MKNSNTKIIAVGCLVVLALGNIYLQQTLTEVSTTVLDVGVYNQNKLSQKEKGQSYMYMSDGFIKTFSVDGETISEVSTEGDGEHSMLEYASQSHSPCELVQIDDTHYQMKYPCSDERTFTSTE